MRRAWITVALGLMAGAGCSFESADPVIEDPVGNPMPLGDGRIFIAWTVGGKVPDAAACSGIDHLRLRLGYRDGTAVSISPIPCALDRFRYDQLPTGTADILLTGYDSSGCTVATGSASANVTGTQPSSPMPTVAVSAMQRSCR